MFRKYIFCSVFFLGSLASANHLTNFGFVEECSSTGKCCTGWDAHGECVGEKSCPVCHTPGVECSSTGYCCDGWNVQGECTHETKCEKC